VCVRLPSWMDASERWQDFTVKDTKAGTEILTQILYLKHYLKHNANYLVLYYLHKIAIVIKI